MRKKSVIYSYFWRSDKAIIYENFWLAKTTKDDGEIICEILN